MTSVKLYNNDDEAALISGCLNGNRQAQETLYKTYASKMYAICLRYASSDFDAKDILQNAFIKIFRRLDSYKGNGVLESWIKSVVVRTCINFYRTRMSDGDGNTQLEDLEIEDPSLSGLDNIAARDLLKIISKLPDGYRAVANLYLVEGYSHKEIGEMLGIAPVTSRTQLARAKAHLQKQIELYSSN